MTDQASSQEKPNTGTIMIEPEDEERARFRWRRGLLRRSEHVRPKPPGSLFGTLVR